MSNVRPHERSASMHMLKRLRYALYVLIAVTMVVLLALGVGEGVGLVHGFDSGRLMFHPLYFLPVSAIGFAVAPSLAKRLPISGDLPNPRPGNKPPFGYAVRSVLLIAFGLVFVLAISALLWLVGRFA